MPTSIVWDILTNALWNILEEYIVCKLQFDNDTYENPTHVGFHLLERIELTVGWYLCLYSGVMIKTLTGGRRSPRSTLSYYST